MSFVDREAVASISVLVSASRASQDTMYEIYPRINEMRCMVHKIDNPDARGQSSAAGRKLLQVKAPQLGFVSSASAVAYPCALSSYIYSALVPAL